MKTMQIIVGALLIIGMAVAATGCGGKIGQPYTDSSWQQPPPGTGGGK